MSISDCEGRFILRKKHSCLPRLKKVGGKKLLLLLRWLLMCVECTSPVSHSHHTMMAHKNQILNPLIKGRLETCRHHKQATIYRLRHNPRTSPLCASYQAAHTAGESLFSPGAIDKTNKSLGEFAANKLRTVSLCCDSISSRLLCMFSNLKQQTQIIGNDYYILKHHKCTDVTNHSTSLGTSKACVVK